MQSGQVQRDLDFLVGAAAAIQAAVASLRAAVGDDVEPASEPVANGRVNTRPKENIKKYQKLLEANEPYHVIVHRVLTEEGGIAVDGDHSNQEESHCACPEVLVSIAKKSGEAGLVAVRDFVNYHFPTASERYASYVLNTAHEFLALYGGVYNRKLLRQSVAGIRPKDLRKTARRLGEKNGRFVKELALRAGIDPA
jgi:hypothetical protein